MLSTLSNIGGLLFYQEYKSQTSLEIYLTCTGIGMIFIGMLTMWAGKVAIRAARRLVNTSPPHTFREVFPSPTRKQACSCEASMKLRSSKPLAVHAGGQRGDRY